MKNVGRSAFKKDDRVVVYATLTGVPLRSKGLVVFVEPNRLCIQMEQIATTERIFAHPKQCRKLRQRQEWDLAFPKGLQPVAYETYVGVKVGDAFTYDHGHKQSIFPIEKVVRVRKVKT